MATSEQVARLEAKLRGFDAVTDGATPGEWLLWRKTERGHNYSVATDPATAEGREWWCEALEMSVVAEMGVDLWTAETYRHVGVQCTDQSRTAAIIAAIEAAAAASREGAQ